VPGLPFLWPKFPNHGEGLDNHRDNWHRSSNARSSGTPAYDAVRYPESKNEKEKDEVHRLSRRVETGAKSISAKSSCYIEPRQPCPFGKEFAGRSNLRLTRLDHFSLLIETCPTTALGPTVAEDCPLRRRVTKCVFLVEARNLSLNTELKLFHVRIEK
jgi:hypothetical protein